MRTLSIAAVLLTALFFGSFANSARAACVNEAVTPPEVLQGVAVPAGKTACRLSGTYILVPTISHEALPAEPPCGKDISVQKSDLGTYKPYMDKAGKGLLASGNVYAMAVGAVLKLVVIADPSHAKNITSNCGIASLTLPPSKVMFHCYVDFYNESNPSKHHAVDCKDFDTGNRGDEPDQAVYRVKDIHRNGRTTYAALFKNWATNSGYYRHVAFTADVFE